jgi:hypothetical protein
VSHDGPGSFVQPRSEKGRGRPGGALGLIGQFQTFQTRQVPCIRSASLARCLKHYFFEPRMVHPMSGVLWTTSPMTSELIIRWSLVRVQRAHPTAHSEPGDRTKQIASGDLHNGRPPAHDHRFEAGTHNR